MTQGRLDWRGESAPVAPARVRMAPSAIEARRTGHARATETASMRAYRDALIRFGPCTDQELAERSWLPLASVNARRNDWHAYDITAVIAVDRVTKVWTHGRATTRVVWAWHGVTS
jgi:hypothetical protein